MKTTLKIVIVFMIFLILSGTVIFAVNTDFYEPNELSQADKKKVGDTVGQILATIRSVGIITAVIALTCIGLKYIFSSLDEKANYKENMVPYVVGCFILASATTIPSIIYEIAK